MARRSTPRIDAAKVFQARDEAGLTQEGLARRMQCSLPSVQKWEAGDRNPTPELLARLAVATGKPEKFFYETAEAAA